MKILILSLVACIVLAQVQVIDRFRDINVKRYQRGWNRTKIVTAEVQQALGNLWGPVDLALLEVTQPDLIASAVQAIKDTKQPEGFEYKSLVSAQQHVGDGNTFVFVIDFSNKSNIINRYQTTIYKDQTSKLNQIVSVLAVVDPSLNTNSTVVPETQQQNSTNSTISNSSIVPNTTSNNTYKPIPGGFSPQNTSQETNNPNSSGGPVALAETAALADIASKNASHTYVQSAVTGVLAQYANGLTFQVGLEFTNAENNTIAYSVTIFSNPQAGTPDQVVSVQQVEVGQSPSYADQGKKQGQQQGAGGNPQQQNSTGTTLNNSNNTSVPSANINANSDPVAVAEAAALADIASKNATHTYVQSAVTGVQTQYANGLTYQVGLEFTNAENNTIAYSVTIFSNPQAGTPDQVISVQQVEVGQSPSYANQGGAAQYSQYIQPKAQVTK